MRRFVLLLGLWLAAPAVWASPLNWFEWTSVAPIVVSGRSLGQNGRLLELWVDRVFRGEVSVGDTIAVELKRANRDRSLNAHPRPLRLDTGGRFVLLLERIPPRKRGQTETFRLVRGVEGARELPAEGAPLQLTALERLIEVQATKSDALVWNQFRDMLEDTNPILVQTALNQFLKFRRGDPRMLASVRPLLDHPTPGLREDAALLIGQIVDRWQSDPIPDEQALMAELVGRARRDDSIGVRIAATRSLDGFDPRLVREVLLTIAAEDPEQEVRYAAETMLLEHREYPRSDPEDEPRDD